MKMFMKYGFVALISFTLGAAIFGFVIKQPIASLNGSTTIGSSAVISRAFISNFEQRDMNAAEARFYPYSGRTVTVDLYVKTQYAWPSFFFQCTAPRNAKLVDSSGESQSGVMLSSQFSRDVPVGAGTNTQVCVYKFAFVVPKEKVLADNWALVVDGSPFPKMNQVDNAEPALGNCAPTDGFSCKK